MRINRITKGMLVGAMLAGSSILALPTIASAATSGTTGTSGTTTTAASSGHSHGFIQAQLKLEAELSARVTQLGRLSTDVSTSTTLTSAHMVLLSARVATGTGNINVLVAKVPTDTTMRQLNADRKSMLAQNRVYAVLTPQVFETIEADGIAVRAQGFVANESALQSAVNGMLGQNGYKNALNHYLAFVKAVNKAEADSNNVATAVLAQVPADYPGDTHVFVNANHELLNADVSLAYAAYDASVIGLAAGGYNGS